MAHALPDEPANSAGSRLTPCQDGRSIAQNRGENKHFRPLTPPATSPAPPATAARCASSSGVKSLQSVVVTSA